MSKPSAKYLRKPLFKSLLRLSAGVPNNIRISHGHSRRHSDSTHVANIIGFRPASDDGTTCTQDTFPPCQVIVATFGIPSAPT